MSKELIQAMQVLEDEKGISKDVIIEALESALVLAYKKNYDQAQNVEVNFDSEGNIKVFQIKTVVEDLEDSNEEMALNDVLAINKAYEVGDTIRCEVTPKDFGRIATQTAKHVILQRLREAERNIVYDEYIQYEDEILTGTVERQDNRFTYINLGKVEAVMPIREQIPNEELAMDQRVKVYVSKVDKTSRGPQIIVSRAQAEFLRRLFENEVPEIFNGIVEIMSISREAGDRSKVAVRSRDSQIDPIGTCVGAGGDRVNSIVNELNGENIDIVEYDEDPAVFIRNAMSPSQVVDVIFEDPENTNHCIVVVPDYQLSLAIGKKGQNARLAARLTGYKIDIKSESDYQVYLEEKSLAEENLSDDSELLAQDVTETLVEPSEDLMVEEIFDEAGSGDPEAQDIGDEIPDEENIESEDILD